MEERRLYEERQEVRAEAPAPVLRRIDGRQALGDNPGIRRNWLKVTKYN